MKKEKEMVLDIKDVLKYAHQKFGIREENNAKTSNQQIVEQIYTEKISKELRGCLQQNLSLFPKHKY